MPSVCCEIRSLIEQPNIKTQILGMITIGCSVPFNLAGRNGKE